MRGTGRRPRCVPPSAGFGPTYPGPSTLVMDAATGRVLSESGADIPRYPASLTKLMTLDLAFQALRDGKLTLDTPLPVSVHAASVEPVKLGLRPGSTITVRQAILAMTTMSANDAATALGEYLGGGSEDARRADDDPARACARHGADPFRQRLRPAQPEPGDHGARPRDPGAGHRRQLSRKTSISSRSKASISTAARSTAITAC